MVVKMKYLQFSNLEWRKYKKNRRFAAYGHLRSGDFFSAVRRVILSLF